MPADLIDTLSRLPATAAITYRGMSGPPATRAFTLTNMLPTSADPRVASENFTAERLAAIVTTTGRSIASLSRHPDELEIVILPGTLLLPAGSVTVPGLPNPVVLLAEKGWAPGLPESKADLERTVVDQVARSLASAAVLIHSPGKFTPQQS